MIRNGRFGKFIGCSGFPECTHTEQILQKIGVDCPNCSNDVVQTITRKRRVFYACISYPECKWKSWERPNESTLPFKNCDLSNINLKGLKLMFVDLSGATLDGADLRGADLSGAKLFGTNLIWANLREANLRRADLFYARYNKLTKFPDGFDPEGTDMVLVEGQLAGI